MKKNYLFFVALLFQVLVNLSLGQTPTFEWNIQYNAYTEPWVIKEDYQKNILVAGLFMTTVDFDPGLNQSQLSSPTDKSIFIQKLDSLGNLIWVKYLDNRIDSVSFFSYSENYMVDLISDNEGNIYFSSSFTGNVDFDPSGGVSHLSNFQDSLSPHIQDDIFICKYSSNGEFIWVKRIDLGHNNDRRIKLFLDDYNHVYLVGDFGYGTSDLDPNNNNTFLIKLDSSGSQVYSNLFPIYNGAGIYDFPDPNCFVDKDGSFLLSGNIFGQNSQVIDIDPSSLILNVSASGLIDGIFAKYDSTGHLVWHKQLRASGLSQCKIGNLVKSDDGNIYIYGSLSGTVDFDPSDQNYDVSSPEEAYFFAKYSSSGDLVWVKIYIIRDNTDFELVQSRTLNNGGVIFSFTPDDPCTINTGIGNVTYTSSNDYYGLLLIFDSNGDYQWSKQYHQDNRDLSIFDLYVNSEDDIFFSGVFEGTVNFDPANNAAPLVCQSCSTLLPNGFGYGHDVFLVKYKFSGTSGIEELQAKPKSLIKIVDLMGRETTIKPNVVLFYQYSDGSVEKKIVIVD